MTDAPPVRIALLATPETSVAVLYGLHEVFASVGTAWEELTGRSTPSRRFTPVIVAANTKPFTNLAGMPMQADVAFASAEDFDAVIVPDLTLEAALDPRGFWPAATDWLRRQYEAGAIVCSVCTGSVLLAEAGLLDGLDATTHWGACGIFESVYPSIGLRPERILVPAGTEHRIVTSGGSASWSDLALYLIARFCGPEEAARTAKVFIIGDRQDGQLPFAAMARPRQHDDAAIAHCQSWIAEHYAQANAVSRMQEHSGLSPRTFSRRFRAVTGYTPIEYVQSLRIEEAKQLLETADLATDAVAEAVGYEDPASFRRIFKRTTGITPARYRQRFRGIGRLA